MRERDRQLRWHKVVRKGPRLSPQALVHLYLWRQRLARRNPTMAAVLAAMDHLNESRRKV